MNEQTTQQGLCGTSKEQPHRIGKWSKIALVSSLGGWVLLFGAGVTGAVLAFALIALKINETYFDFIFRIILGALMVFSLSVFLVGITSAVVALVQIRQKKEDPKGMSLAIFALCASGCYFVLLLSVTVFIPRIHQAKHDRICRANLSCLGKGLQKYAAQHNGQYPDNNTWCDSLVREVHIDEWRFYCTLILTKERNRYNTPYTLNPCAEPNSPESAVLLFEAEPGWNQSGGPEIATFQHYDHCPVLLNNGHVKFVKQNRIRLLNWNSREPNCGREDISK
jgi:4-amino-4-deoxy-L-arabinose transferase-like glycosyltransferase